MAHQKSPNMSVKLMNKQEYMLLKNLPSIQPLKPFKYNSESQCVTLSAKVNPFENIDRNIGFSLQNKEEILTLLEYERNERTKLENLINEIYNENKRLKNEIGALDSSRLSENRLIQDYEQKIQILRQDLQAFKRDQYVIQEYESKMRAIQLQLDQERNYQESQLNLIRSQQIEIKNLTDEIGNNLKWKEESENKIALLAQEIQRLTIVLNDKQNELDEVRMKSSSVQIREFEEHRLLIVDLKNEINKLTQKNYQIQNDKDKIEMELLKYQRENEGLRMSNDDKSKEIDNLAKSILAKEKQHFQNMEDMRSKYDLMRQSVLNSEITEIQIRHKTEIIQLESLVKQFQSKNYDCESQLKALQLENDRLQNRLNDSSTHQGHQIESLNNQINSLTLENQHLSSKLHLSQNEVNNLNEQVFELQQQISTMNTKSISQIDKYHSEIERSNHLIQDSQQQLIMLKMENESNKIKNEQKQEEIQYLKQQLQQSQDQQDATNSNYQQLQDEYNAIKNNLLTNQITHQSLTSQLHEHSQTHDKLQIIISQLQDQLNIGETSYKMTKQQYERDLEIINQKLQEAQKLNLANSQNYQVEIQQQMQKNMALQFELDEKKSLLHSINQQLYQKDDLINELNDKLIQLKQNHEYTVHDLKSSNASLIQQYQFELKQANDKISYNHQHSLEQSAENQVLKDSLHQYQTKLQEYEHKIFQLEINLKSTQDQYNSLLIQLNSLRNINEQNQSKQQIEELNHENLELTQQIRNLQQEIIAVKTQLAISEQKVEYQENVNNIKKKEHDDLNSLLNKWKQEAHQYQENNQKSLIQQNDQKNIIIKFEQQINDLNMKIQSQQTLNNELKDELYSLQINQQQLKQELSSVQSQLKQKNLEIEMIKTFTIRGSPMKS